MVRKLALLLALALVMIAPALAQAPGYSSGPGSSGGGSYQPSILPVPAALSSFTWVNQGTATATNNGNSISMKIVDTGSSLQWRLLEQAMPATPYSVAAFLKTEQFFASSQTTGFYFYDGTKLEGFEFLTQNSGTFTLRVERIASVTSDSATEISSVGNLNGQSGAVIMPWPFTGGIYVRLRNNGTTLYFDYSIDGSNWTNYYSESVGTFITPTAAGFGASLLPAARRLLM